MWAFGIQNPIAMKHEIGIQVCGHLLIPVYLKRLHAAPARHSGVRIPLLIPLYLKRLLLIS